jgi:hypothetical protein
MSDSTLLSFQPGMTSAELAAVPISLGTGQHVHPHAVGPAGTERDPRSRAGVGRGGERDCSPVCTASRSRRGSGWAA